MRKLLYVPIIHLGSDLGSAATTIDKTSASFCGEERWSKHKETVTKSWANIADYFAGVDATNLKIYQDGLPVDGELGQKILEEGAKRGSKNYQIILDLIEKGAEIRKTEDTALLKEEYESITKLNQAKSSADRKRALANYKVGRNRLTRERDKFIAKTIDKTLKEGETGVLFIGSYHDVLSHLPKDIAVQQIKDREMINAYFEELIAGKNEKRLEELAEYLISPCVR
jgi:hypothetical protein